VAARKLKDDANVETFVARFCRKWHRSLSTRKRNVRPTLWQKP